MYKETVVYTDFNDLERTEDHYFHLNEAELTKLEMGVTGGFVEMVDKAIKAKDGKTIMDTFDDIMHKSYGVKSPDGRRLIKNDDVWSIFCAFATDEPPNFNTCIYCEVYSFFLWTSSTVFL